MSPEDWRPAFEAYRARVRAWSTLPEAEQDEIISELASVGDPLLCAIAVAMRHEVNRIRGIRPGPDWLD